MDDRRREMYREMSLIAVLDESEDEGRDRFNNIKRSIRMSAREGTVKIKFLFPQYVERVE